MHVGLLCPTWPPDGTTNGIVTYVRVLRDELQRLGHRVSLFSGSCEQSEAEGVFQVAQTRREAHMSAIRRRFGFGSPPPYEYGRMIASAVLRRHAVSPLDVFEMEESFGWFAHVAARLPLPTVVKLHGPAFLSLMDIDEQSPELRQRICIEGNALRSARSIVAPSRSTLLSTAARYSLQSEALVSVANPIAPIAESLVWRFHPDHVNDILFVGRFDYRKGGDAMLLAFAQVVALRPAARLSFVGPDAGLLVAPGKVQHFQDFVRSRLTSEVAARIRFLGSLPTPEIQALRLRTGVTVATTRWESFGYVVAEAMNQGCPIVGFDVDGVNELICNGESGLLAPLDDIDTLASMICRVLDDRHLAESLGARARAAVVASCGAEKVAEQMLAVYRDARVGSQ